MKKISLLFFVVLASLSVANAQSSKDAFSRWSADSIAFKKGDWKTKYIHLGGIRVRQCSFKNNSLFESNQFITVMEVKTSFRFDIVADTSLAYVADFVRFANARAGLNGSFVNTETLWNSEYYLRVDSLELAPHKMITDSLDRIRQNGAVAVSGKGKLSIHRGDSQNQSWESGILAEDLLTGGPLLRYNGRDEILLPEKNSTQRHARTAVAVRKSGRVVFVVIDGATQQAEGVTMEELQAVMRWLRADDALNLNGDASSTMCLRRKDAIRTLNHPADNNARKMANAIVFK